MTEQERADAEWYLAEQEFESLYSEYPEQLRLVVKQAFMQAWLLGLQRGITIAANSAAKRFREMVGGYR